MLVSVNNGGFQLGGGTESEARYKTPSYQRQRRPDDRAGAHQYGFGGSVAYWKSLTQANVRSPGQFTFDGSITGLPLADFLSGQAAVAHPGDAELARHAAVVSRALRAGHVEAVAEGDVELRSEVGAWLRAADPQRRDLQLQRRSLQQQHQDDAVCQCTAWIPVSR